MCVAPNTQAFSGVDYDDSRHDAGQPEMVPMTRLQVAMSREIGGWPLYTIVIAAGQVRVSYNTSFELCPYHYLDVERHEFPDYSANWPKLAR